MKRYDFETLSTRFRCRLKMESLTHQQIAATLGINRSTIGMYCRGEREPHVRDLLAMCTWLGVGMDEFVREEQG